MASSPSMLIIGGSGFVSGALARQAAAQGFRVWAVTRGQRRLPEGVAALVADRDDPRAFADAIAGAGRSWDLAVECIGYQPQHVRQDVAALKERAGHYIFISTDYVYDPFHRQNPQPEETAFYWQEGYGRNKRLCELALIEGDSAPLPWTVVRPCHVYGPGSLLGSLPLHRRDPRLIERLRAGEALRLANGGRFLHHPIFAPDLARTILSLGGNPRAFGQVFNAGGPEVVEARDYFGIVARILGVELKIEDVPVGEVLAAQPDEALSCIDRVYDLSKLRALGGYVPGTPLEEGLRMQVERLL